MTTVQFSKSAEEACRAGLARRSLKTQQHATGLEHPAAGDELPDSFEVAGQVRSTFQAARAWPRRDIPRETKSRWRRRARFRAGSQDGSFPRKEVIQPQLPLRLPCYDFTPVTSPTFDGCLP